MRGSICSLKGWALSTAIDCTSDQILSCFIQPHCRVLITHFGMPTHAPRNSLGVHILLVHILHQSFILKQIPGKKRAFFPLLLCFLVSQSTKQAAHVNRIFYLIVCAVHEKHHAGLKVSTRSWEWIYHIDLWLRIQSVLVLSSVVAPIVDNEESPGSFQKVNNFYYWFSCSQDSTFTS